MTMHVPQGGTRAITQGLIVILLLLLAAQLDAAQAQQSCQPRMDQDASLNNLVHPPAYETTEVGTLGRVIRRGDGPRGMVLVAGAGFGGEIFEGFMEANQDRFTMFAITLPGFGGTPAPPMPPPGTSYAEQTWTRAAAGAVARLIAEEQLERAVIVGHWISGGQVAMNLALERPDLINAAIVISGVLKPITASGQGASTPDRLALNTDYQAATWFKTVTRETWDDNNFLPRDYAIHPLRALQLWKQAAQPTLPVWIRYLSERRAVDSTLDFPRLEVPMLVLKPGLDELFFEGPQRGGYMEAFLHQSWEGVEELSDMISMQVIDDSRVFIMDDQPQALNEAIQQFLEGPGSRARRTARVAPVPQAEPTATPAARKIWQGSVEQQGDRYLIADSAFAIERPDATWELEGVADSPPLVARMWDEEKKAQITIQVQPVNGASLDSLVPAIEGAVAAKFEGFVKKSSDRTSVNGHDAFQLECTFELEGEPVRGRLLFAKLDEDYLFTITFRASPDDFDSLQPQFDKIYHSIDFRSDG